MGMGGHGVPQDDTPLGAELREHAMDDRAGRFRPPAFPRRGRRQVGKTPAGEVTLAGEGDARPAHALIAGRFTHGDDAGLGPFLEVIPEIGEPDVRRPVDVVGPRFAELIEGATNGRPREVAQEGIDRGDLVTIGQCS